MLLNKILLFFFFLSIPEEKVYELDSLFYYGNYLEVIKKGEEYLKEKELNKKIKERILILLSQSYIILGEEEKGKEYFSELLKLNPKFKLDPKEYSPKIIEVLEKVKRENIIEKEEYKKVIDKKIFIYPGLYQLINNEKLKGYTLISLETTSLLSILPSYLFMKKAHRDYLNEREEEKIEEKYKIYKISYNLFYATLITASFTYIFHLIDITF
ncbi:MAG: hypothetical protein RMJ34_01560 [candidate division WOR-3 bacterium]|nr:hypothetical protein [candidate division WOR-3 bacterium]MDW8113607.1 hypothetical protein [candidate division WOR-3 bacterium]